MRGECWGESPGRYRQSAHGTHRQDDHCGSEQAPCQRGSHLASTPSPGRYFMQHFSLNSDKSFSFCFGYFCLPPSTWWQGVMDELCLEPSLTKTGSHLGKQVANSEVANLLFSWTGSGTEWADCGHLLTAGRQHVVVQLEFFLMRQHHLHFEHKVHH